MNDHQLELPYPISILAQLFPPMSPEEFGVLLESIHQDGLLEPILLWNEQIADGVHRLRACLEAGVEPRFERLPDDFEAAFRIVVQKNVARRHLDESRRAIAAYRIHKLSTQVQDEEGPGANLRTITLKAAAAMMSVSRRLATHAARVMADDSRAVPALRQAADQGVVRISDASRIIDLPQDMQEQALALVTGKKAKNVTAAARQLRREAILREETAARDANLARPLADTVILHAATVVGLHARVERESIDAIITHLPDTEEALSMLRDLAHFADHALKLTGVMVVVGHAVLLPSMLERLRHERLIWTMELDLLQPGLPASSGPPHGVALHRRPVLVFGKAGFRMNGGSDLIEVPPPNALPAGLDRHEAAMGLVVSRFCGPGEVICDPHMSDRSGTVLAARQLGSTFIGATERQSSIDRIQARLAQAENHIEAEHEPR